jgi:hypothetical protein
MRASILAAAACAALFCCFAFAPSALAGVSNPDISVIGQPWLRWTDAAGDPARKRLTLDPGETEFIFDGALNPYARGTFVVAFGDEGASVEELLPFTRGLPAWRSRAASTAPGSASSTRSTRTSIRSPTAFTSCRPTCPATSRSTRPACS